MTHRKVPDGIVDNGPRVLIVENLAHLTYGHMPNRFAELAEAFDGIGIHATILTPKGWSRAAESGAAQLNIVRYVWWARWFDAGARLLRPSPALKRGAAGAYDSALLARAIRRLRSEIATFAAALAVRHHARNSADCAIPVLFLNIDFDPIIGVPLAGTSRWLVTMFRTPDSPVSQMSARLVESARSRNHGTGVTFSAPSANIAQAWSSALPCIEVEVLPLAGVRSTPYIVDARDRLGIDPKARVCLLFGTHHPERDSATVLAAFHNLPEWTLLVAGQLTEVLAKTHVFGSANIRVFPGRADNNLRELLYSVADLSILSFKEGYERNSGTLMDAISAGHSIACSDGSHAARIVRQFRLGEVFTPGDSVSLARAVRHARPASDENLAHARADLSNRAVATRLYLALTAPRSDAPAMEEVRRNG